MRTAKKAKPDPADQVVNLMLIGGRVTASFRDQLFAAAGRAGTSVNEFVIRAVGEKLWASGANFSGVFTPGDLPDHSNDNQDRTV